MTNVKEDRIAFLDTFGKQFVNWDENNGPISEDLLHYNKTIASFASPKATQACITAFGTTDFPPRYGEDHRADTHRSRRRRPDCPRRRSR